MKARPPAECRLARNEGPAAGDGLDEPLAHEDADGAADGAGGQARLGAQRGKRGQLRRDLPALNLLAQASGELVVRVLWGGGVYVHSPSLAGLAMLKHGQTEKGLLVRVRRVVQAAGPVAITVPW